MALEETAIAVRSDVKAACELLGLDPLYVANEGRFVAFVSAADEARALEVLKSDPACPGAALIGHVSAGEGVSIRGAYGTSRRLAMLSGEQLPRIC
jgi:hydrogenase expression/formation protein HypE